MHKSFSRQPNSRSWNLFILLFLFNFMLTSSRGFDRSLRGFFLTIGASINSILRHVHLALSNSNAWQNNCLANQFFLTKTCGYLKIIDVIETRDHIIFSSKSSVVWRHSLQFSMANYTWHGPKMPKRPLGQGWQTPSCGQSNIFHNSILLGSASAWHSKKPTSRAKGRSWLEPPPP